MAANWKIWASKLSRCPSRCAESFSSHVTRKQNYTMGQAESGQMTFTDGRRHHEPVGRRKSLNGSSASEGDDEGTHPQIVAQVWFSSGCCPVESAARIRTVSPSTPVCCQCADASVLCGSHASALPVLNFSEWQPAFQVTLLAPNCEHA